MPEDETPGGGGSYEDAFRPNYTNATGGSTGGQPDTEPEPAAEPAEPATGKTTGRRSRTAEGE